jgi:FkbM family methyltransferase
MALGIKPFSALNQLDRKLLKYLDYENGFFIEVGANDGISQSNTFYFEQALGWRGLLIEPVPELFELCCRFRKSRTLNCALGPFEQEGECVEILFSDLMSVVEGAKITDGTTIKSAQEHARLGRKYWRGKPYRVSVPVKALSNILRDENVVQIDLFSLDVEGYEKEVLSGVDFNVHRPKYILVETGEIEEVLRIIPKEYKLVDKFSHHDYLLKLRI